MSMVPMDRDPAPAGQDGETPKLVDVRESIRYRRRAQEAEQRCTALESEVEELRRTQSERATSADNALAEERRQRESLEQRVEQLHAERLLERELIRGGARDPETALLVARERLAAAGGAETDLARLAREVLEEKPYLKADQRDEVPPLGRTSQGVRPSPNRRRTRADRLAASARASGRRADVVEYMRARRCGNP